MFLADVMDEIGDQLDTIAGLRVYRYPADSVTPPAAVVSYPESIEFDGTYTRGMDRITLPVLVVVGRQSDRASRDNLSGYVDGTGSASFKAVLESGTYTSFDSVRVTRCDFDVVSIAGTDYVAGLFELDIVGKGAP